MSLEKKGFTATFTYEKSTKNTHRYQEDEQAGQPPRIGSLYIQKWAAKDAKKIKVTVEVLE